MTGAVQALKMENDAPVVGPDAPTVNSKMVKLDIATAGLESAIAYSVRKRCMRQGFGFASQLITTVNDALSPAT